MILFITSTIDHIRIMWRPWAPRKFAVSIPYQVGTRTMSTLLRKYNSSIFTFGIYLALVAFAVACSLGLL